VIDAGRIRAAAGSLGRVVVARLAPGVELFEGLAAIAEREGLRYAIILGGAASLRRARLRNVRAYPQDWPIQDEHRAFLDLEGPLELLSISGNISRCEDGTAHIHAHAVVSAGSPEQGRCFGGHLVCGTEVFSTCEIVLGELAGVALNRRMDEETRTLELYPEPL